MPIWLRVAVTTAIVLAFPAAALAGTSALQPFPTNLDTVADSSQVTGLRVNVPLPPCASFPSDCADDAVLNSLDGFNIQPRIRIPFSGPIDTTTVSSSTIFLVGPAGHVVGINQPVWEPLTSTLYVESDEQLAQDSTYLLVVTRGIHDANGNPLDTTSFRHDLNFGQTKDPASKAYRKALLDSLSLASLGGAGPDDIAAASLFTTQSISAISEKIRNQIRSAPAPVPNFNLAPDGSRTVFANVAGALDRLEPAGDRVRPAVADGRPGRCNAGLPGLDSEDRLRLVRVTRLRERLPDHPRGRHTHRHSRGAERRTSSCSRSSSRPASLRLEAGPSRSSATASPTR